MSQDSAKDLGVYIDHLETSPYLLLQTLKDPHY